MLFRDLDLPGWPCMATVGCILANEQLFRFKRTPAIETIRPEGAQVVEDTAPIPWIGV